MDTVLSLQKFGASFGENLVLAEVDLEVPATGITLIMGPAGAGKSTLLRSIAGLNDANPQFRCWGKSEYLGGPLEEGSRPGLVQQHARLFIASILENVLFSLPDQEKLSLSDKETVAAEMLAQAGLEKLIPQLDTPVHSLSLCEQRQVAIARTYASKSAVICVDEPTADLSSPEQDAIVEQLLFIAQKRSVLAVTHHQQIAKALGGRMGLLVGGKIQEEGCTEKLLSVPESEVAKTFIKTGSCQLPSLNAKPEDLAEGVELPPRPIEAIQAISRACGPRGFYWLISGRLAGTPQPGIIQDLGYDLSALQRVGITFLVNLTENDLSSEHYAQYGIETYHFPIIDMEAPELQAAKEFCIRLAGWLEEQKTVALHCKAGLGRTGTMLACFLIYQGRSALSALEHARSIEPRWVQSDTQVEFLSEFEKYCREPNQAGFL
ncbi:Atypical dual specificity phosphatase [Planctomycetales bacterium 10988]|nr:Atypical dual specificity phosphatase [Planctomycetales bacterium 10988]